MYWLLGSSVQKIGTSRRRRIPFAGLQTQEGWCRIRPRQPQPHARTTIHSCNGEFSSMGRVFTALQRLLNDCLHTLSSRLTRWSKPLLTSLPLQTIADLGRSKPELIAENALLRQQLIILRRQVKRPSCTNTDRLLLLLLARMVRTWKQTLLIVQEDDITALAS